jgi:hypothetical protein
MKISLLLIQQVLQEIKELGLVSIFNGSVMNVIPPLVNLYSDNRWDPTVNYLKDYSKYHQVSLLESNYSNYCNEDFSGDFFLCVYDGWREYSPPIDQENRIYTSWITMSEEEKKQFIGYGSKGEERFIHNCTSNNNNSNNKFIYPELPLKVISYNRHVGDRSVLLIPDYEFIVHQFSQFTRAVISYDEPFDEKISKMFWRGSGKYYYNYRYYYNNFE